MALRGAAGRGADPRVAPASARHQIACAHAAAALARRYPQHLVCGERELQRDERALGRRLASARMSWRSRWGDSHRPDLVIWPPARRRRTARGRGGADGQGAGPPARDLPRVGPLPATLRASCIWRLRAALAPVARAIRAAGAEDRIALLGARDARCGGGRARPWRLGAPARRARRRRVPSQALRVASGEGVTATTGGPADVQLQRQPSGVGRPTDTRSRIAIPAVRDVRGEPSPRLQLEPQGRRRGVPGAPQLLRRLGVRDGGRERRAVPAARAAAWPSTAGSSGASGKPPSSRNARP